MQIDMDRIIVLDMDEHIGICIGTAVDDLIWEWLDARIPPNLATRIYQHIWVPTARNTINIVLDPVITQLEDELDNLL